MKTYHNGLSFKNQIPSHRFRTSSTVLIRNLARMRNSVASPAQKKWGSGPNLSLLVCSKRSQYTCVFHPPLYQQKTFGFYFDRDPPIPSLAPPLKELLFSNLVSPRTGSNIEYTMATSGPNAKYAVNNARV